MHKLLGNYLIPLKKAQIVDNQLFALGNCRDDRIRTCDHTPPRRVLYRAELHPVAFFTERRQVSCFYNKI